jgi:hypothetical protein
VISTIVAIFLPLAAKEPVEAEENVVETAKA